MDHREEKEPDIETGVMTGKQGTGGYVEVSFGCSRQRGTRVLRRVTRGDARTTANRFMAFWKPDANEARYRVEGEATEQSIRTRREHKMLHILRFFRGCLIRTTMCCSLVRQEISHSILTYIHRLQCVIYCSDNKLQRKHLYLRGRQQEEGRRAGLASSTLTPNDVGLECRLTAE